MRSECTPSTWCHHANAMLRGFEGAEFRNESEALCTYFVEKGAESNGHTAGLIVLEELRASLISDIKVSGLVMVTPKQARKLTQDLPRGIRKQGLHISREFLQGQVGLSHKQGFEPQHSSEQNEGSTGTVSLTSAKESLDAKGDALGREGMEHAKQDAHEVPIRTDTQAKHIEEEVIIGKDSRFLHYGSEAEARFNVSLTRAKALTVVIAPPSATGPLGMLQTASARLFGRLDMASLQKSAEPIATFLGMRSGLEDLDEPSWHGAHHIGHAAPWKELPLALSLKMRDTEKPLLLALRLDEKIAVTFLCSAIRKSEAMCLGPGQRTFQVRLAISP